MPRVKTESELRAEELERVSIRGYAIFTEPDADSILYPYQSQFTLLISLYYRLGNCQIATTETAADGGAVLRGATLAKIVEKLTSEQYRGTEEEEAGEKGD